MEISLTGTPAHAAYPNQGKNPALLIAQIITYMQELINEPHQGIVLGTVIGVDLGSKSYGLSAYSGMLRLTLRGELPKEYDALVNGIANKAKSGAAAQGLQCAISFIEPFPATVNHEACVKKLQAAAVAAGLTASFLQEPMRWSEDFGHYLQKTKGAFFGIGCGKEHTGLHTAGYKFDDEIIESAIAMYLQLIL